MNQSEKDKSKLDTSKLEDYTNEELKDRILKINKEQLLKISEMSYYYIIGNSSELIQLVNRGISFQGIKSKEEELIIKNFGYIIDSFKNFHVDITEEGINEEIKKLLDIRKELYNLSNAIEGYEIELSYVKEMLDQHTMKIVGEEEYKDYDVNKQEITLLINRISEALSSGTTSDLVFVSIVSNILSIMPFRMSKSRFFDVIKMTLTRNLKYYSVDLVESRIEHYKMLFDSSLNVNYGITFDNYFTNIQKMKNIRIEGKSIDELDDIAEDIIDLNSVIKGIRTFINSLGVMINRLIIIYMNRNTIIFNPNIKDIFLMWKENEEKLDETLLNSLIESSNRELTRLEKQLLEDIKIFETFNKEGLKREGFFDEKLNDEMLFTKKVLAYYNDMEFSKYDLLFPEKANTIDDDYLEQLVDNLIQYINRSISTMNNIERKIRMRRLLSLLELPFQNIEEFLSYIDYSLDERIVSKEEILFTIDTANYWLDGLKERQ